MAGYALARLHFRGKQCWFFLILTVLVVPAQITLPGLAIYAFFNRYLIQGVTFTGGKG